MVYLYNWPSEGMKYPKDEPWQKYAKSKRNKSQNGTYSMISFIWNAQNRQSIEKENRLLFAWGVGLVRGRGRTGGYGGDS